MASVSKWGTQNTCILFHILSQRSSIIWDKAARCPAFPRRSPFFSTQKFNPDRKKKREREKERFGHLPGISRCWAAQSCSSSDAVARCLEILLNIYALGLPAIQIELPCVQPSRTYAASSLYWELPSKICKVGLKLCPGFPGQKHKSPHMKYSLYGNLLSESTYRKDGTTHQAIWHLLIQNRQHSNSHSAGTHIPRFRSRFTGT